MYLSYITVECFAQLLENLFSEEGVGGVYVQIFKPIKRISIYELLPPGDKAPCSCWKMNIEKERKKKEKVRLILMGFWMSGNDKFGRTRFFTW